MTREPPYSRRRPLLGMAAGRRLGALPALGPRDIPARLNVPEGDRSVLTLGHAQAPRRRGALPLPPVRLFGHTGPFGHTIAFAIRGAGAAPLRWRGVLDCLAVRTLRSPSGSIGRVLRSREHAACPGPRRPLAAMPSKTDYPHDRSGHGGAACGGVKFGDPGKVPFIGPHRSGFPN